MSLVTNKDRINNFEKVLYGKEQKKADFTFEILENLNVQIDKNSDKGRFINETCSRMEIVTLLHSLESIEIANEYIKTLNQKGLDFQETFKISENDFKISLLIHDVGKISIDRELLLSNKQFSDRDREEIKSHSLTSLETFKLINEQANPKKTVEDVFSSDITDVAVNHHLLYLKDDLERTFLKPHIKLASMIDMLEAMSSDNRYYKTPSTLSEIYDSEVKVLSFCRPLEARVLECFTEREEIINYEGKKDFKYPYLEKILETTENKRNEISDKFETFINGEKIIANALNDEILRHEQLLQQTASTEISEDEITNNEAEIASKFAISSGIGLNLA